jgi:hypothetical protein
MSKVLTITWLRSRRLLVSAAALLGLAAVVFALQPAFPASGAPDAASRAQMMEEGSKANVVFQVTPTFIKYPEGRIRDHGVWFVAAGLQPEQEVKIRMVWGVAGLETDITSVLDVGYDKDLGGLFANIHGAFVVAFERGFRGAASDFVFYGEWQAVSFRLHDALTGDLLAVAPAVLCGPALEEPWCNVSSELVPIE